MDEFLLTPGQRVEIEQFGEGTIIRVNEPGDEAEAAVSELETVRVVKTPSGIKLHT